MAVDGSSLTVVSVEEQEADGSVAWLLQSCGTIQLLWKEKLLEGVFSFPEDRADLFLFDFCFFGVSCIV